LPYLPAPALDDQGGTRITTNGDGSARLALDSGSLRLLTVDGCPELVELDLSACPGLSWIAIADCPLLTDLRLPAAGPGARIHVDFGPAAPCLTVTGLVADVDCCWLSGQSAAPRGRSRRPPLDGCYIGPVNADALMRYGLVLFTGGEAKVQHLVLPPDGAVRELVLDELEHLDLGGSLPMHVEMQRLPRLRTVTGSAPLPLLRADRCDRLRRIDGFGEALTVVSSAQDGGLEVPGPWTSLLVRDSAPAGVLAPFVEHVSLPGAPQGEAAEAAVGQLLQAARAGDPGAVGALLHWCGRVQTSRGVLGALVALESLASAGHDADALWSVRCGLRHRAARRGLQPGDWWWSLPRDLDQRGWDADLGLWLRAQASGPSSSAPLPAWHPVHLVTLASALRKQWPETATEALTTLLMQAFGSARFGRNRRRRRNDSQGLAADDTDRLRRTVHALAALRCHPRTPALVLGFCRWLARNLEGADRANLLGALHLLGAADAREHLLRIAAGDGGGAAEERALAMGLAVAPVRADIFSFKEVLHA
jgi:hypothetical protein